MQLSCRNVALGWQSAIGEHTFGPSMQRVPDLWAWQRAVLNRGHISPEEMALVGLVLEYAIEQADKTGNTTMHELACTLFHNLSFGE